MQPEKQENIQSDLLLTSKKKPYHTPILKIQCHLRDITLGSTPGITDSTNPYVFRPGTFGPDRMERDTNSDDSGKGNLFDNDLFGG